MSVKIFKKPRIDLPTMLAGWPGMGSVGIIAVNHIRRMLGAEKFAEIDISRYSVPDAVEVRNGVAALPQNPACTFYYTENPPAVFFEGDVQMTGQAASTTITEILDFCESLNVKRIFTGAAFASNLSSSEPSYVYGAANSKEFSVEIEKLGVRLMPEGQISGMNGTLIGFAGLRKIDAACLLATMPVYAVSIPNPKASLALTEVCEEILFTEIDKKELKAQSREMEDNMVVIEEKIKEIFPLVLSDQEKEFISIEEDKIPAYIIDKIERLFSEAQRDRRRAEYLKQELDRWNLYEYYEDRFLSLFREE